MPGLGDYGRFKDDPAAWSCPRGGRRGAGAEVVAASRDRRSARRAATCGRAVRWDGRGAGRDRGDPVAARSRASCTSPTSHR